MTITQVRRELDSGKRIADIKLNVTFYARVSTDSMEQESSLKNQKSYFHNKITANANWSLVEGYIDDGISGTTVKNRLAFLRMIDDAKEKKFDLILTKEISRFARDTVDSLQYTRRLLDYDVGVFFEDIGLNTIERDSEFRLAIMASVAQEESRKLSERTRFGFRQAFKNGVRHGPRPPLGYEFNDENNGYSINQKTAPIIRQIFKLYVEGNGLRIIGEQLAANGYCSETGEPYTPSILAKIIRNPKYKGYMAGGRYTSTSYRNGKRVNVLPAEWILQKDWERVPPIVDEETWERANALIFEKGSLIKEKASGVQRRYLYSGKIICGNDSMHYHRLVNKKGDNEHWVCRIYKNRGISACRSPVLYTSELNRAMKDIFKQISANEREAADKLIRLIEDLLSKNALNKQTNVLETQIALLRKKKEKLLQGWMDEVVSDADYREKSKQLDAEEESLWAKQKALQCGFEQQNQRKGRLDEIRIFLQNCMRYENNHVIEGMIELYLKKIIVRTTEPNEKTITLDVHINTKELDCFDVQLEKADDGGLEALPPNLRRKEISK